MTGDETRKPEPTLGTDEEGEIALNEAVDTDDRASWVHSRKDRPEGGSADRPDARDR